MMISSLEIGLTTLMIRKSDIRQLDLGFGTAWFGMSDGTRARNRSGFLKSGAAG